MSMMDKLKELEAIRAESEREYQTWLPLLKARKTATISTAVSDFKNFFEGHGYKVQNSGGSITATLGTVSNVTMTIPSPDDVFAGSYSVFKLNSVSSIQRRESIVLVNKKGSRTGVTSEVYPAPMNEAEELDRQIKTAKQQLQGSKEFHEELKNDAWTFGLVKGDKSNLHDYPQFETMGDLLKSFVG